MKITAISKKGFLVVCFLIFCLPVAAQVDDPDEDADSAIEPLNPSAPIDNYILPVMILGIVTTYYLFQRKVES